MALVRRKLRVVLLVDDHAPMLSAWRLDIRHFFSPTLRVLDARDKPTALSVAATEQPDLAIIDQHLGDGLGTDLLPELHACAPNTLTLLTSADPTFDDALRAEPKPLKVVAKPRSWAPYLRAIEAGTDLRLVPEEPAMLSLDQVIAAHISRVLRAHCNNVSAAARALAVDRSGLQRKLEKLGITIDRTEPLESTTKTHEKRDSSVDRLKS